jgi:glycosyltransferase involved in cell wall biosynthesis
MRRGLGGGRADYNRALFRAAAVLHVHHVNLQPIVGGGEVYTRALTRALADAGARVTLYVHPRNRFWDDLVGARVVLRGAANENALERLLPTEQSVVVTQSPVSEACVERMARRHFVAGFAHMPVDEHRARGFRAYGLIATVSHYCLERLARAGVANLYPEPIYGVADLKRSTGAEIRARSPYLWDPNKVRDRLLGLLEPLAPRSPHPFAQRAGLTLGIVSLIAPIKQFPRLFELVGPLLAARASVNLEVFGAGGYAQVRDLRRALAPLGSRARFWGYQTDVAAVYPVLDYLLTGLPEREALGLNVLEAQACGTPVLAPCAPPFTETVLEGASGFLYRDPREDGGAHFAEVLDSILAGRARPDPRVAARAHLDQFGYPALVERTRRLASHLAEAARIQ